MKSSFPLSLGVVIGMFFVLGGEALVTLARSALLGGTILFPFPIVLIAVAVGLSYRDDTWRKVGVGFSVFMLLLSIASIFFSSMPVFFGVTGAIPDDEASAWSIWSVRIISWILSAAPFVYAAIVLSDERTKSYCTEKESE
jgi:hypothetical protein